MSAVRCSFVAVAAMTAMTDMTAVAAVAWMPAAAAQAEVVRVILVGDSTMAPQTGYGDALCQMFKPGVTCINLARRGRSSGSFRAEGWWDQVMILLRARESYRANYVLIQFGHNDQPGKQGRSTDLAKEFPANMARYVNEVKSLGAVPVLVTPLTRRIFRDGVLHNDLAPWADATRKVAESVQVPVLDLNADSSAAVAAMGSLEADTLAMVAPEEKSAPPPAKPAGSATPEPNGSAAVRFDYTHLGPKGAAFFARMVARELGKTVPAIGANIKPDDRAR